MIDLRRLQVLRAVAYYGTVTAAAGALHMTVSAASQQIRQLGRELGVTLLVPRGRTVELSDAAQCLLAHADAIEARWQEAQAQLEAMTDEPGGLLRLGGFATAAATLLAPAAERLAERFPQLTVRVQEAEPDEALTLLFSGQLDLAIVEATRAMPPPSDARFDQELLLIEPFDLLVPHDHPFSRQSTIELTEAARERWIISGPDTAATDHIQSACSAAGFAPEVVHQAREWAVIVALVAHGQGVALVPRLAQLPIQPSAKRLPVTGPSIPSRRIVSCVRRGSSTHPRIMPTLEVLHDIAATTI